MTTSTSTLVLPPVPTRRRWLLAARVLGFAVVVLSLRWILLRLGADGAELAKFRPNAAFLVVAGLAIPAWTAAGLLPATAWARFVATLAGPFADPTRDMRIFARLQISKYLPGHAFQVARHAMTRTVTAPSPLNPRGGVPHTALGAAATCEALGMITAAAAVGLVGFGAAFAAGAIGFGFQPPRQVLLGAPMAAFGATLAFPWLLSKLAGSRWLPGVERHDSRALLPGLGFYTLEKAAAGLLLGALLATTAEQGILFCLLAGLAAYPLAWVTGYLTPATPAGAGAVEAVLVAVLGSSYGAVPVLAAALGLRLVMVAGDSLLALLAYLASRNGPEDRGAEGPWRTGIWRHRGELW